MGIGKEEVSKAFPVVGRMVNDEAVLRLIQKEVVDIYETYRPEERPLGGYQQVGFSSEDRRWAHLGLSTGLVAPKFLSQKCPVLASLLENFDDQGFSAIAALMVLRPGPDIPPHIDTSSMIRRLHIPIIVPDKEKNGKVTMTVDGKSFDITEFEPYFFDQELVHSVKNGLKASSDDEDPNDVVRINLLIDIFVPTKWSWLNFLHRQLYALGNYFFAKNHKWTYDILPKSDSASFIKKLTSQPMKKKSSGWNGNLFMFLFREIFFHKSNVKKITTSLHDEEENRELSKWAKKNFAPEVIDRLCSLTVTLYHSIKSRIYVSTMLSTVSLRLIEIWAEHIIVGRGVEDDTAEGDDRKPSVPGGFLEAGVWRGGSVIFMKYLSDKLSKQQGQPSRPVYALDCYEGMENIEHSSEEDDILMDKNCSKFLNIARKVLNEDKQDLITTSVQEVKENFEYFLGSDILSDSEVRDGTVRDGSADDEDSKKKKSGVTFVKGWMDDPKFDWDSIGQLSMIRLDMDYYKPTKIALGKLYDKLSVGGIVICDEYNLNMMGEYLAVDEFRTERNITSPLIHTGEQSAYWIKTEP